MNPETMAQARRRGHGQFDLGVTLDGRRGPCAFLRRERTGGKWRCGPSLVGAVNGRKQGTLPERTVVATTMSEYGLEIALRESGIRMRAPHVGDKYVAGGDADTEERARAGWEQSGHIFQGW